MHYIESQSPRGAELGAGIHVVVEEDMHLVF